MEWCEEVRVKINNMGLFEGKKDLGVISIKIKDQFVIREGRRGLIQDFTHCRVK